MEESKFADNNFWALPRENSQSDVDALLAELEDEDYQEVKIEETTDE